VAAQRGMMCKREKELSFDGVLLGRIVQPWRPKIQLILRRQLEFDFIQLAGRNLSLLHVSSKLGGASLLDK
jgi:hypothetical protein